MDRPSQLTAWLLGQELPQPSRLLIGFGAIDTPGSHIYPAWVARRPNRAKRRPLRYDDRSATPTILAVCISLVIAFLMQWIWGADFGHAFMTSLTCMWLLMICADGRAVVQKQKAFDQKQRRRSQPEEANTDPA